MDSYSVQQRPLLEGEDFSRATEPSCRKRGEKVNFPWTHTLNLELITVFLRRERQSIDLKIALGWAQKASTTIISQKRHPESIIGRMLRNNVLLK